MELQRVKYDRATNIFTFFHDIINTDKHITTPCTLNMKHSYFPKIPCYFGPSLLNSFFTLAPTFSLLLYVLFSDTDISYTCTETVASWKKIYDKPRQCIKNQRHHFANKSPYSQTTVFPVVMYRSENWVTKKVET